MLGGVFGSMFTLKLGLPVIAGFALTLMLCAIIGVITEFVAVRPVLKSLDQHLYVLSTLALALMVQQFTAIEFSTEQQPFPRLIDLPRVDFFHWTLVDIPAGITELAAGQFSGAVTTRGKAGPAIPGDPLSGARHGLNDYTSWFAGDGDMSGDYFGYDGPCPPWNDAIAHRYVFTLYAIDQEQLTVTGKFTGTDVHNALQGHVLAQAALTGTYSLNPDVIR